MKCKSNLSHAQKSAHPDRQPRQDHGSRIGETGLADKRQQGMLELDQAIGEHKLVSTAGEVWRLATEGRGRLLLVEQNFHLPARVNESGVLSPADDAAAPDKSLTIPRQKKKAPKGFENSLGLDRGSLYFLAETLMVLGLTASALGKTMLKTPFSNVASALSCSTGTLIVNVRLNLPWPRS